MTATQAHLPHLIDLPAVAQRLGVNQRHIRRLVAERRIPFVKWGHLLRFDPAEIQTWIDSHRRGDRLTPPVPLVSHRRPALADPPRDS